MGKYMKKPKISGDVAGMKVQSQSSHGVRTRAKTLASHTNFDDFDASSFSYLQLRSRRLPKVFAGGPPPPGKSHGDCCRGSPNSNSRVVISDSRGREIGSVKSAGSLICEKGEFLAEIAKGSDVGENVDVDLCMEESSFGENVSEVEVEEKDRSTGDSPPCSFTRDSYTTSTPASSAKKIICEHVQRNIPMAYEIEEFFAFAEKQHHRIFMEKYNFDIVNDVPLSGRYEWVQVLHKANPIGGLC